MLYECVGSFTHLQRIPFVNTNRFPADTTFGFGELLYFFHRCVLDCLMA